MTGDVSAHPPSRGMGGRGGNMTGNHNDNNNHNTQDHHQGLSHGGPGLGLTISTKGGGGGGGFEGSPQGSPTAAMALARPSPHLITEVGTISCCPCTKDLSSFSPTLFFQHPSDHTPLSPLNHPSTPPPLMSQVVLVSSHFLVPVLLAHTCVLDRIANATATSVKLVSTQARTFRHRLHRGHRHRYVIITVVIIVVIIFVIIVIVDACLVIIITVHNHYQSISTI